LIREEAERETCTTRAEEHHQEFEICMSSLLLVDTFVNEVAAKLRESNANVQKLEKETVACIVMEHKQEQHIKELTSLKEGFSRAAAAKVHPVVALKVAACISHNRKLVLVFMHIIPNMSQH
jgi:hypothetical protein